MTRKLPRGMRHQHGAYYLDTKVNGKRRWIPLGKSYHEALQAYHDLEKDGQGGELFIDLYHAYLEHEYFTDLSPNTQERYRFGLTKLLAVFQHVPVADIRPADVGRYLDARKGYRDAANTERGILKRMMDLAVRIGWREDNPVVPIIGYKGSKRNRVLTADELGALIGAANAPVRVAVELGYMTGLRIGDLLALRWGQVTSEGITVEQAKNRVVGRYTLSQGVQETLRLARKLHGRTVLPTPDLPVIHNRKMEAYTYYGFRAMFRQAVERAGMDDVRFHDIRRTAITAAAAEGRDPQAFSLHKSARMAAAYVNRVPEVEPLKLSTKLSTNAHMS